MPSMKRAWVQRYGIAVVTSLLTLLLRFLLQPLLGGESPLLVFIMPVMVSAWYGGLKPGLLSTALCALVGVYFFLPPFLSLSLLRVTDIIRVCIFLVEGVLISCLCEALRSAKQRTEAIAFSWRESEERYRLLVEGVEDYAILMLDPGGRISSWNNGAQRIQGYKAAEIQGRHYSIFFTPEDIERHAPEQQLQIATAEGHFVNEGWRRRKDGSLFWASVALTSLRDEPGNLRGFSEITRDISERKRAEEELHKLVKDLSDVKFALDRAAILAVTDAQGIITDINDKFCQTSKYFREELIGQTHRLVNSGYHPKEFFRDLWSTITKGHVWHGEIRNRAKDGTYYWVDTTIVPFLDDAGKPFQYLAIRFDITNRKHAEEVLQRLTQRLEALHEIDRAILRAESPAELAHAALSHLRSVIPCQQAAIALFNFATNQAQLLAGELNSRSPGEIVALSDLMPIAMPLYQGTVRYIEDLTTVQPLPPLLQHQLAEGQRSWLSAALMVEGELIGQLDLFATEVGVLTSEHQEIASEVANQLAVATQQARLREQLQRYATELEQRVQERTAALQEANAELETFGYSVAHDLRAPLRAMQGFGQALLEDYTEELDEMGQTMITHLVGAAEQMDGLITDLLEYSRLSRTDIQIHPMNLSAIITEVRSQLQGEIQARQAILTVEEPLPEVMGHRAILVQVIANLVSNAIKFVPADVQPTIRIWAEETGSEEEGNRGSFQTSPLFKGGEGGIEKGDLGGSPGLKTDPRDARPHSSTRHIRLWVEDNGIGIEKRYQTQIFRVFERLHGADTYPGSGIGLAIVRKGIERLGGQVGLESQIGQGSRFWIELERSQSFKTSA